MFGWDQKDRLLRESWTADELAQELYAMFGAQVPNNTAAPVNVTLPPANKVAPYQVTDAPANNGPAMTINRNDGTTVTFNNDGTVTGPDGRPVSGGGGGGGGGPVVPVWG